MMNLSLKGDRGMDSIMNREQEHEMGARNLVIVERLLSGAVQEQSHPVIEAIKRDASSRPYEYIQNYTVPAEGE